MGLTLKQVARERRPGRYLDGHNLYLQVTPAGSKSWLFRYERLIDGRRREHMVGLGATHIVGLDEARELARQCRQQLFAGIDPLEAKRSAEAARASQVKPVTFEAAARAWFAKQEPTFKSAKHSRQVLGTLTAHAFPTLGNVDVAAIDTGMVLAALRPIWAATPETASRLRGRIESVLAFATVAGMRQGDNPARWQGHLALLLPAPAKLKVGGGEKHHAALAYSELPAFWQELAAIEGVSAAALRFLILTAARTGEATRAVWSEIDFEARTWSIAGERMKMRKAHVVPLSAEALAVLASVPRETDNPFVFIGRQAGKGLSDTSLISLLQERMRRRDLTVHGFRSSFSDWANETTNFSNHSIELSLAHAVGSSVEKAYRRGDMMAKRRKLLEAWSRFVTVPCEAATVVPFAVSA